MTLAPPTTPLRIDETGTIRIGTSRVTLDSIVGAFRAGITPEQLAEGFPTICLADIYFAIGYYLSHQAEIEQYLREGERQAEEVLRQSPDLFPTNLRKRLEARQELRKSL
jgi:uncharacterized protein (DUF433 family)